MGKVGSLLILIILFSTPCYAWNKNDTYREVAWQTIHIIDWGQTLDIARNPDSYHEFNLILGRHPSVGRVNTYMVLSSVGHVTISVLLPDKVRKYWQWITIGTLGACVVNNFSIGLKVRF